MTTMNNEWGGGAAPEPREPHPVEARASATGDTPVAQSFSGMTNVNQQFAQHLDVTHRNAPHYSPEGLRVQIQAFADTNAAKSVDRYEQAVLEREAQAGAEADRRLRELSPDGDTATELRNDRARARAQRALDKADSPVATAKELIERADRTVLGVLLRELPSHLEASGQPTDWIPQAVAAKVPEYAEARAKHEKARQGATVVRYNANVTREGFRRGRPPVKLVDPSPYDPDRR
jgi:hypothetical protein